MRRPAVIVGVLLLVVAALTIGVTLYARAGGSLPDGLAFLAPDTYDPLGESSPEEAALRALRLSGIGQGAAWSDRDETGLRMVLAGVSSAADVEISLQTGFATLAGLYSDSDEYVVQLFDGETPLVEARADGASARTAVAEDDERALRAASRYAVLDSDTALPADAVTIDVDRPGGYLDDKNRAAGLLAGRAPWEALEGEAAEIRLEAPGIPAVPAGEDAGIVWAVRALAAFESADVEGADVLRQTLRATPADMGPEEVLGTRAWALVGEALSWEQRTGSLLADAASSATDIAGLPLEPGPLSDAVLASADSPDAPIDAVDVAEFERVESLDVTATAGPVAEAFDAWQGRPDAQSAVVPPYDAYERADGSVFWVASATIGAPAATDASVRGWAFTLERAALVEPGRVGRVFEYVSVDWPDGDEGGSQ